VGDSPTYFYTRGFNASYKSRIRQPDEGFNASYTTTPEHSRVHRPLGSAHTSAKVIDALDAETERQRQERRDRTDTHIFEPKFKQYQQEIDDQIDAIYKEFNELVGARPTTPSRTTIPDSSHEETPRVPGEYKQE
jgi:hypothetical protein